MFLSTSTMDFSEMTLEEVMRTYSSVKGHRTRCEREINSLIEMLKVQYSAPSEVRVKPSAELKPKKFSHDASMATFRTWKKQFRAYYDAGNLGSLPCAQQQAYLNNCVDETLASRIDRESTRTTPVHSPIQGLMTCVRVLENYFLEVNPIHLRRKRFFDERQKEGQSIIEFRDELLSLIDEANGANIGVNDLVCMMLQIGASDTALQRELGAIKNPTLPAFNMKIEGFEQARKTTITLSLIHI